MPADSNAELVTDYLDDALEGGKAEDFERWLEDSPEARREVEDLRKLLTVVRELPQVEAPPDFYDKLARRLRRRRGPEASTVSLLSMPFQVLSVIIIMVIAATYLMLEIERDDRQLEADPSAAKAHEGEADEADAAPSQANENQTH